jgi:UTP--glucose-1-phosphate uridylyltransferase
MNAQTEPFKYLPDFVEKMMREGISPTVIETFEYYYKKAVSGETGMLYNEDLVPICVDDVMDAGALACYWNAGEQALKSTAVIILNGGLGTSMGLTGPKSLLTAKDGRSFLEIILRQAQNDSTTLVLMNSFSTHEATLSALARLNPPKPPLIFMQNKYPKILQDGFAPVHWPQNPRLEWNPPGHGDIYTALYSSGMLDTLLDQGIVYAFVANSDNLGACMEKALLGYFATRSFDFMMEVSDRTPADMKGGHVARHKNQRLLLREAAQCPKEEQDAFRDIRCFCFFNTNNIWVNLKSLKAYIQKHRTMRLPMILNPKTLDPRDESSPVVYQIETAMGSAVSLFDNAAIVKVPRSRFFPVKKCNELLAIRSDCYLFSDQNRLIVNPERQGGYIRIDLDPRFYGRVDQLDARFPHGVPSLVDCESLTVVGDVRFEKNVKIIGNVKIENKASAQAVVTAGAVLSQS